MIVINVISLIFLVALVAYIVCFLCKYRVIPQSLSITAEYSGRYTWWKLTMCISMGWMSYYYPTVYPYRSFYLEPDYGLLPMLAVAGVAGLSMAGYYSYFPGEEDKQTLMVHKIGSFLGAVCIVLFYVFSGSNVWQILAIFAFLLALGFLIKGKRKGYPDGNSVVFWLEIGVVYLVASDIIDHFLQNIG